MPVPLRLSLTLLAVLIALACPAKTRAQIYADVTVAGAVSGTFTITLEHVKTPGTVANFIGLATGRRGWLDRLTGAIRYDGYYNGVTFHRVIAGFMNQTGSRAGDGTDGPGYAFKDEFDATLTHSSAYVVSMANSGKHTNGSQIFITAAPQPSLNGKHAVFGRVTAGMAVCDAINVTPTVPPDRPAVPITITGITVYGPSYAAFDLAQPLLPVLKDAAPFLKKTGASFALAYDHRTFSEYFGFHSGDLAAWTKFINGYSSGAPATGDLNVTALATGAQRFFRLGRCDYSTCANLFVPASLAGKTLTFPAMFGFVAAINAAGTGGTYTYTGFGGGSGPLIEASYVPQPYWGNLFLEWGAGYLMAFDRLEYTSATGGTFAARTNIIGYENVSGTFTSTP